MKNGNQMCPCELAHALFLRRTELCLEGDVGMSASLDFAGMKHSNRGKKQKVTLSAAGLFGDR